MNIVLTNDDGIYAKGILELALTLDYNHNIILVAPDRERSAAGHSITLRDPLRRYKVNINKLENIDCYCVNGTPADCVKLGVERLVNFKPDLIVSGINNGPNLGFDVLYSGTVSAAIEGHMLGYKSIAVSLDTSINKNYRGGASFIGDLINKLDFDKLNKLLLNVNIPDIKEISDDNFLVTKLGKTIYNDHYEERLDPMGNKYFWLAGEKKKKFPTNTDIWAINNNIVSITPIKLNLSDFDQINMLKKQL